MVSALSSLSDCVPNGTNGSQVQPRCSMTTTELVTSLAWSESSLRARKTRSCDRRSSRRCLRYVIVRADNRDEFLNDEHVIVLLATRPQHVLETPFSLPMVKTDPRWARVGMATSRPISSRCVRSTYWLVLPNLRKSETCPLFLRPRRTSTSPSSFPRTTRLGTSSPRWSASRMP